MTKSTIVTCDLCGEEASLVDTSFWAKIEFKSLQYLYDDGTQDQRYTWDVCRSCKLKVIKFIQPKKSKKEET